LRREDWTVVEWNGEVVVGDGRLKTPEISAEVRHQIPYPRAAGVAQTQPTQRSDNEDSGHESLVLDLPEHMRSSRINAPGNFLGITAAPISLSAGGNTAVTLTSGSSWQNQK
jgi:hypothetical protein